MYSCRFQKGHCYLGDKCTFAHGQKECSHWITLYRHQVQHLAQLRREGLLTESFSEMVRRRIRHEGQHHVVSENLFLQWFFHHLSYHYIPPILRGFSFPHRRARSARYETRGKNHAQASHATAQQTRYPHITEQLMVVTFRTVDQPNIDHHYYILKRFN